MVIYYLMQPFSLNEVDYDLFIIMFVNASSLEILYFSLHQSINVRSQFIFLQNLMSISTNH